MGTVDPREEEEVPPEATPSPMEDKEVAVPRTSPTLTPPTREGTSRETDRPQPLQRGGDLEPEG